MASFWADDFWADDFWAVGFWAGATVGTPAEVPYVENLPYQTAIDAIENAGFTAVYGSEVYSDDVPTGSVISQTPQAGTTADTGSLVTIHVSAGPMPLTYYLRGVSMGRSIQTRGPQNQVVAAIGVDYDIPGHIRADAAGAVTYIPAGNINSDALVTVNMLQGEVSNCLVRKVTASAVTLHLTY